MFSEEIRAETLPRDALGDPKQVPGAPGPNSHAFLRPHNWLISLPVGV